MTAPLTLSQAQGRTDTPLIEQTIGQFFDAMAARQGAREALVCRHQGLRYTYAELHTEVRRLASALLGLGLQKGDRIGIWSHNNAEWVLMQFATAQVGLVLVNINPAYRTSEVEYALNKVGCKALVTMARFKTSDYAGMLQQLGRARLPQLQHIFWIDTPGQGEDIAGMQRFSALMASGDAQDARIDAVAATLANTDPINIQFTAAPRAFPRAPH